MSPEPNERPYRSRQGDTFFPSVPAKVAPLQPSSLSPCSVPYYKYLQSHQADDKATQVAHPQLPRFRDTLEFEAHYGFTKRAAWRLLEDITDPLEAFRTEKKLRRRSPIQLTSADPCLQNAFYAAVALCTQLGVNQEATQQAGAFLSQAVYPKVPLIFDTGCGFLITPFAEDFVTPLQPPPPGIGVTNFENGHTLVEGVGWVEWNVKDATGRTSVMRTQAYLISSATVRLFSPGNYSKELKKRRAEGDDIPNSVGSYSTVDDVLTFHDEFCQHLEFALSTENRIPAMDLVNDDEVHQVGITDAMMLNLNIVHTDDDARTLFDVANTNLSKPQKELKLWHCRLAHCGFPWVQDLMRVQKTEVGSVFMEPVIPTKHTSTPRCEAPKCSACIYAKQHRRTPGTQRIVTKPETEMAIRRNNMKPGEQFALSSYK